MHEHPEGEYVKFADIQAKNETEQDESRPLFREGRSDSQSLSESNEELAS
jgi:hypothetical protein